MIEPKLVVISKGIYTLGVPGPPDNVLHKWLGPRDVKLNDYMIAETSVTVGEIKQYWQEHPGGIASFPKHLSEWADDLPAGGLSWLDAIHYAGWLRAKTGKPYRLPSSGEWEAAARGGQAGNRFPWGNESPEGRSDFAAAGNDRPKPVKSFGPNGYGLYDMAGSIWNWCSDLWIHYTLDDPAVNTPTGLDPAVNVILRGGSFMTADPGYLMCAYMHEDPPDLRHPCLGMRLACDLF